VEQLADGDDGHADALLSLAPEGAFTSVLTAGSEPSATVTFSVDSWYPVHPPHKFAFAGYLHHGMEKRSNTRSQKSRFCWSQSIPVAQAFSNRSGTCRMGIITPSKAF
ncbi:MAG: hypothetical protein L0G69_09290, partial [Brevibacterium sp.]|nr:hypothetical protein [Brevibacterium sp.]